MTISDLVEDVSVQEREEIQAMLLEYRAIAGRIKDLFARKTLIKHPARGHPNYFGINDCGLVKCIQRALRPYDPERRKRILGPLNVRIGCKQRRYNTLASQLSRKEKLYPNYLRELKRYEAEFETLPESVHL